MDMKSFQLPHTGDFYGWRVEMLDVKGRILFSFTQKISGTELATAKSRGCVMSDEEALEKLRLATEETARNKAIEPLRTSCG